MLYCVTEFSNAEIADPIWKVQLLKFVTSDETLPHSVHQSSGLSGLEVVLDLEVHDRSDPRKSVR